MTLDFPVLEQLDSGQVANAATVIYEARSSTVRYSGGKVATAGV